MFLYQKATIFEINVHSGIGRLEGCHIRSMKEMHPFPFSYT